MEPYLYRGTEASEASSNKIARYHIQICVYDTEAYLAKIENLEYETHGNWIFSIFLRVDSLKKKCLSLEYLWWFFEICPGAINPEEFLLSNVHIVHCTSAFTSIPSQLLFFQMIAGSPPSCPIFLFLAASFHQQPASLQCLRRRTCPFFSSGKNLQKWANNSLATRSDSESDSSGFACLWEFQIS